MTPKSPRRCSPTLHPDTPPKDGTLTPSSTSPSTTTPPEPDSVAGAAKMDKDGGAEDGNPNPREETDGNELEKERKRKEEEQGKDPDGGKTDVATENNSAAAAAKVEKKKCKGGKRDRHDKDKKDKEKEKEKGHKNKAKKDKSASSDTDSDDADSESDSRSDSDSDSDSSDSDSSSSSEDKRAKLKRKKQKAKAKRKAALKKKKKKRREKKKKADESSDDSSCESSDSSSSSSSSSDSDSSDSDSESESERRARKKKSKKSKRRVVVESSESEQEADDEADPTEQAALEADAETVTKLLEQANTLQASVQSRQARAAAGTSSSGRSKRSKKERKRDKKGKKEKSSKPEYKRVDQLWDNNIHDWKVTESAEDPGDLFSEFVFTVRRRFDWDNKYKQTRIDIKSKLLRAALQEIMKDVKSVSLVEEEPDIDPNMLFLYLEEARELYKKGLKQRIKKEKKRKAVKKLKAMRAHLKVLVGYLDKDYAATKKKLYPLLQAGNITFDLLWALFKPNSLAFSLTYGTVDNPRCFKVDYATKESSFMEGEWYSIEGRYLDYDGHRFGLGEVEARVEQFQGPRKIAGLAAFPLQYHKEEALVREQLLERGKKFVMMQGMNYKLHRGLAFMKVKHSVKKVNVTGRIMIDPAIFRRINPNYQISVFKPKTLDESDYEDAPADGRCCRCSDAGSDAGCEAEAEGDGDGSDKSGEDCEPKTQWKVVWDENDEMHLVKVPVDENGKPIMPEKFEPLPDSEAKVEAKTPLVFTEEELLIASPVVLGFSFGDKLWLEFSLSGVEEIEWNDEAFESLVLPSNHKDIVTALVSSHKFHAAETIDDVVQGKGRGLVFVLHGPPGVGKTLTGEGIAEMLRCPLYMVSAGELGTDHRSLERELLQIMDIAHSWGAVLLLDEADVFLEKRQIHDIARNALVSIFLRLLEYFQGILFLTTNRVETFDEAFQSRIHVALRYDELGHQAKKDIWRTFLEKVRKMEGDDTATFTERDYELLARNAMNGRQIKNAVRTAQALAVNEKTKLSLEHIERVLSIAESFGRDMRGLTLDAMKSYI